MAKYRIDAIEPRDDGSGNIAWDIWALDDDDLVIPARHKMILTPYDETQDAIEGGDVANALKALLVKYASTGWDNESLDGITAENLNAVTVDAAVDEVIDGFGGLPLTFAI